MNNLAEIYENDFHAWITAHIELLKAGKNHEIDTAHLIEELEYMGKSNLRELESRLMILIAHLLKWQFQPDKQNSRIIEERILLKRLIKDLPSLKNHIAETIIEVYSDVLDLISRETKLSPSTFPLSCPYSIEQLLNENFYPTTN